MRKANRSGGTLLCLILNILLNLDGIIPALILLALHFWLDISIWWAVAAGAIWLLQIVFWTLFWRFANKCGNTHDLPRENKNPYSVKNSKR